MMKYLKKKNKASFVFFIITLYALIGFSIGYVIWEFLLQSKKPPVRRFFWGYALKSLACVIGVGECFPKYPPKFVSFDQSHN